MHTWKTDLRYGYRIAHAPERRVSLHATSLRPGLAGSVVIFQSLTRPKLSDDDEGWSMRKGEHSPLASLSLVRKKKLLSYAWQSARLAFACPVISLSARVRTYIYIRTHKSARIHHRQLSGLRNITFFPLFTEDVNSCASSRFYDDGGRGE